MRTLSVKVQLFRPIMPPAVLRGRQAQAYAGRNGFPVLSSADLVAWREREMPVAM
jgi:hypothetical protein